MDKLAHAVGMDPVEFRILNAYRDGDMKAHRREAKNCALIECVQVAAEKAGWPISPRRARIVADWRRRGAGSDSGYRDREAAGSAGRSAAGSHSDAAASRPRRRIRRRPPSRAAAAPPRIAAHPLPQPGVPPARRARAAAGSDSRQFEPPRSAARRGAVFSLPAGGVMA